MKQASSRAAIVNNNGTPPDALIGVGVLNAYRTVGGFARLMLANPSRAAPGSSITVRAITDEVIPSFGNISARSRVQFSWKIGNLPPSPWGTISSQTIVMPASGSITVGVQARDPLTGFSTNTSASILSTTAVGAEGLRTLYALSPVSDWATFFNDGSHDRIVNAGVFMAPDCRVEGVFGIECSSGICNSSPMSTFDGHNRGFTVYRPDGVAPNNLETNLHQWHDGLSSISTKIMYVVRQPAGVNCATSATSDTP